MNYFDDQDRYFAMDELNRLMCADTEVHTDADLGLPEGAVTAIDAQAFPEEDCNADL